MIPEGLSFGSVEKIPNKEEKPTLVFIGRLKKDKLPDHAITPFQVIQRQLP